MSEPEILDEFKRAQQAPDAFERVQRAAAGGLDEKPEQGAAPMAAPQAVVQEEQPPEEQPPEEQSPEVETPEQPPVEPVAGAPEGEEEESAQDTEPEGEEPDDSPSIVGELALSIPRGVEGALEGIYGFLDFATGDALPDWDRDENSWLGKSQTTVGLIGESLVQFGVGFIPGLNVASALGKVSKMGKLGSALTKSKGALKTFAKGQLSLSPSMMKKLSKVKQYTKTNMRYATAGAISEFFVFKGQEQRLSNLLVGSDDANTNALIAMLAYNPDHKNKDKWYYELQERGKTALEGLIIGEAMGLAFVGLGKAYRGVNPKKAAGEVTSTSALDIPEGKAAVSFIHKILGRFRKKNEIVGDMREAGEPVDEFKAVDDALNDPETQPTTNEANAARELEQRNRDTKGSAEHEAITGEPKDSPSPEGVEKAGDELAGIDAPEIKHIDAENATEAELDDWLEEYAEQPGGVSSLETKRAMVADILKESGEGGREHLIKGLREHVVKMVEESGLFKGQNAKSFLGAIRLINSVPELRALLSHVSRAGLKASREARKGVPQTPKQASETYEAVAELVKKTDEMAGGNGVVDIEALKGRVKDLERVTHDAEAIYGGLNVAAKDIQTGMQNAQKAFDSPLGTVEAQVGGKTRLLNAKEAMTELYSAMDRFSALQEIWGDFGRQLSLNMRQRNDLYLTGQSSIGRDIAGQHRTLGISVEDALSETGKRFRREMQRSVGDKRVVKDLQKLFRKSGLDSGGDVSELIKGFDDVGVASALSRYTLVGRKGLAISQEWYYNAILGAPTSWAVNFLGGALVLPLRHIESIAGGVATGNINLVKANFRVMFDIQSFSDSLKYAWKSGIDDEARSISGHTAFRDDRLHTPKGEIYVDNPDGNAVYSAINFVGHLIRHPSRIMMGGDEFFKQLSYRARIKTSLALEGYNKGLHRQPGKLGEHINDGFNSTITKDGRFRNEGNVRREALMSLVAARNSGKNIVDEKAFIRKHMDDHFFNNSLKIEDGVIYSEKGFSERQMLVEAGTDWALMNTFTNEVTNRFFKKTGEVATMSPWLGFVIPFVRTPSNILLFALGRTLPTGAPKEIMGAFKTLKEARATTTDDVLKAKGIGGVRSLGERRRTAKGKDAKGDTRSAVGSGQDPRRMAPSDDIRGGSENLAMPEARRQAESYLKMIESESSIKAAEAVGRLSTGIMTMGAVFMNLENILDRVTGSPPEDPGKRAAWAATGKMPFAIRFGDRWHSYQRLDPFATTLGLMADITHGWADMRKDGSSEFGDEDEFEEKQAQFAQIAGVLATAFANNVSNKSYIENLGELLDILEKPAEAFANVTGNVLGGFVPNGLNWSQNVFQEEPAILEARSIMDKMRKRLPEAMRSGKKLMPRRNGFGEIMRKSKNTTGDIRQNPLDLIKGLNPIFSSDVSNDIVDMEVEHQAVGRNNMADGRIIRGNRISYKSYRNKKGDTAYDRMQELSGTMRLGPRQLTLRQALRATIESSDYQRLPPITESNRHRDHPRSKALTRILNIYRAEARRRTTGEFQQLRADLAELLK